MFTAPSSSDEPFAVIDKIDNGSKSLPSSLQLTKKDKQKIMKNKLLFLKIHLVAFIRHFILKFSD